MVVEVRRALLASHINAFLDDITVTEEALVPASIERRASPVIKPSARLNYTTAGAQTSARNTASSSSLQHQAIQE